jgi:uncharacterized cupredoxin-like copper-binding protein
MEEGMKRHLVCLVLILIATIILVACGESQVSMEPVNAISVEMNEFKFSPPVMVVFAGKEISLNLSNNGAVEHEFSILKKGSTAQIPFDREKQKADILFEARLGAKNDGLYKFILPEPGEYQVICGIQGHMESGMIATLTAK